MSAPAGTGLTSAALGLTWLGLAWLWCVTTAWVERRLERGARGRRHPGATRELVGALRRSIARLGEQSLRPTGASLLEIEGACALALAALAASMSVLPILPAPLPAQESPLGAGLVLAALALSGLALTLAGAASATTRARIGAIRLGMQSLSGMAAVALAMAAVVHQAGSTSLDRLVSLQAGALSEWNLFVHPFLALSCLVMVGGLALLVLEPPFDAPLRGASSAGSCLGELSGWRRGLLELCARSTSMVGMLLVVTVYLGGWSLPVASWNLALFGGASADDRGAPLALAVGTAVVWGKAILGWTVFALGRHALPRQTSPQAAGLALSHLIPWGLVALVGTVFWRLAFA